ncbi:putative signal peptide protein [Puccinia sorghi]|uniref:Putative signal peptide protein n=1 Tax=Puccinia sorghi TaxID=27349 RepID=A0A0L6U8W6_9BASI|nr:putative signal peptide protein [Puccinia sorghi]
MSKLANIFMSLIDLLLNEELFVTWIGFVKWFVTATPKGGWLQIVQVKTDLAANFFGKLDIHFGFSNQGLRIVLNRLYIFHHIWVFRGYTENKRWSHKTNTWKGQKRKEGLQDKGFWSSIIDDNSLSIIVHLMFGSISRGKIAARSSLSIIIKKVILEASGTFTEFHGKEMIDLGPVICRSVEKRLRSEVLVSLGDDERVASLQYIVNCHFKIPSCHCRHRCHRLPELTSTKCPWQSFITGNLCFFLRRVGFLLGFHFSPQGLQDPLFDCLILHCVDFFFSYSLFFQGTSTWVYSTFSLLLGIHNHIKIWLHFGGEFPTESQIYAWIWENNSLRGFFYGNYFEKGRIGWTTLQLIVINSELLWELSDQRVVLLQLNCYYSKAKKACKLSSNFPRISSTLRHISNASPSDTGTSFPSTNPNLLPLPRCFSQSLELETQTRNYLSIRQGSLLPSAYPYSAPAEMFFSCQLTSILATFLCTDLRGHLQSNPLPIHYATRPRKFSVVISFFFQLCLVLLNFLFRYTNIKHSFSSTNRIVKNLYWNIFPANRQHSVAPN